MDSGRSLAQVIMQMQNEIRKLESENKLLRGQLPYTTAPVALQPRSTETQHRDAAPESSLHPNLRRNASAPALEGQYKENIIMTVRRYSISSNTIDVQRNNESSQKEQTMSNSHWTRVQEGVQSRPSSALSSQARDDKLTNRRSLQQYVNKNRAKVKTVTFLLPVDDIYTNRPVSANRLSELNVIAETDS